MLQFCSIWEYFFLTVPAAGHEILRSQLNIYTFQITSESVWLIALIGLNTFSTHNVSENSLKKLLRTRFWGSILKKWLKWPYSALGKGFSELLCIKPKNSHTSQSFLCNEVWSSLFFQDSLHDKFRTYEELKATSTKRGVNSGVLYVKMY